MFTFSVEEAGGSKVRFFQTDSSCFVKFLHKLCPKMFRRKPTRLELKVEDLQEFDHIKNSADSKDLMAKQNEADTSKGVILMDKQAMLHARIGYKPQPRDAN